MIGILFAYLLDKSIRGLLIYRACLYMPVVLSLALVGFIWKGVMWSPSQGMFNVILGRTAQGNQIDWVGNAEKVFTIHVPGLDTPLGLSKNFAALLVAMAWRHIGYVMVLYLAGLKSVDPSLREAAAIDGCNEWQSFRRVVFPVMKPINVVVFVITVIEALRAFDIIFALKKPPGTQVLGILVRDNLVNQEGGKVGLGSAYGDPAAALSASSSGTSSTTTAEPWRAVDGRAAPTLCRRVRRFVRVPDGDGVVVVGSRRWRALRISAPVQRDTEFGIFSPPRRHLQNYRNAWTEAAWLNRQHDVIVIPALFLWPSRVLAFAVIRFSWRFNVTLLLVSPQEHCRRR